MGFDLRINMANMKTTKTLLTGTLLFSAILAFSQKFPENRIVLSFNNDSLHHVLRAIAETQPDRNLHFNYSRDKIKQSKQVTASLDNVTLTEALEQVLEGQPIYKDFQIVEYSKNSRMVYLTQQPNTGDKYFDNKRELDTFYRIGDKLPNIPFQIENYHRPNALLHDFKGKLLILDMWAVNCSGCIAAFPKMEALQEKFGDKIQIILATKDSKAMVDELRTRSSNVRETTLPIVTGESPLAYFFDYQGVPIHYWVDEEGVLKYITHHSSEELISDYLAGKELNLTEKRDTVIDAGYDRPIGVGLHAIHRGNFGISSYLAPHDDSVYNYAGSISTSYSDRDTGTVKSYKTSAASLHQLYKFAYNKRDPRTRDDDFFPNSWIVIETKDPMKFIPIYGHHKKNLYDFELIVKNKNIRFSQFLKLMQSQLDAYFGMQSSLDEREVDCFVLKRVGGVQSLSPKDDEISYAVKDDRLSGKNVMWWKVLMDVNMKYRKNLPQLLDETGLDPETLVDINMSIAFDADLDAANRSLAPYGLAVEKTKRKKEVIVLKEQFQ
jgi:Thiol-disulfide isomerase and thioredoxins